MTRPTLTDRLGRLASEIGALDPLRARAELLVAAAHDTRDRDVWGGDRAITYWDRLPDRIRMATYSGPSLSCWWERCTRMLGCTQPRRAEDRSALAGALAAGDDRVVLNMLRTETEALCLRVRLAVQLDRDTPTTAPTDTDTANQETLP